MIVRVPCLSVPFRLGLYTRVAEVVDEPGGLGRVNRA
jgi:hypothetical protein